MRTPRPLNFSPRSIPIPYPQFPNSNRIISFADPHPLNPAISYRYKNHRGQGGSLAPQASQPSTFNFRLSVPPSLSPLSATLMDSPASVANKRLTQLLSPLDATLTKNQGGPRPSIRESSLHTLLCSPFVFRQLWECILQLLRFYTHTGMGGTPLRLCPSDPETEVVPLRT